MAQIVHTKINVQRKITSILLCQLCFNFLLYHTSKIQHLASNLKLISKIWYVCIRTFEYFPIRIFIRIIFVSFFWYEYIRIFVRIAFLIRIYSDICSYHFFDTNIFGYSFVSSFWYKYIRIFVCIVFCYEFIRIFIRIIFLIRIYSDIRSYRFLIRIYSREKSSLRAKKSKS